MRDKHNVHRRINEAVITLIMIVYLQTPCNIHMVPVNELYIEYGHRDMYEFIYLYIYMTVVQPCYQYQTNNMKL